jgi:phage baseplate assembly protein W
MPQVAVFPLLPSSTPAPPSSGGAGQSDAAAILATDAFLGIGLLHPFRRDLKSDFASGTGADLVSSNLRQILGTKGGTDRRPGEVRWRSRFGSQLHTLRHASNNPAFQELARLYVVDPVRRWEPRARIKRVELERLESGTKRGSQVHVRYDLVDASAGQRVIERDVTVSLPVGLTA